MALGAAGWEGYARHVEHAIKMINRLINKLTAAGWAVVNDSRMAVACLVPPDSSIPVNELVDRVVASGNSWVSMTRFEGQAVVRACATNGTLTEPDVDQLVAELIHYAMGAEAPPKKRG